MICGCVVVRPRDGYDCMRKVCDYHDKFKCEWVYPSGRKCKLVSFTESKYCHKHELQTERCFYNKEKCNNPALPTDIYCKFHVNHTLLLSTQQKLKNI